MTRIICNSWPKAGTHVLLEFARLVLGEGAWYHDPDIKYPEGYDSLLRKLEERSLRHGASFAVKGHFGRSRETEEAFRAPGTKHLFIVRDPRDVLCSTHRWLRDLRRDWPVSKYLTGLTPSEQLMQIIEGLPVLPPFDQDFAIDWSKPFPERYAHLSAWLDAPDCCVLRYEDLTGRAGPRRQQESVEQALRFVGATSDEATRSRILAAICNPRAATFHTGPESDWMDDFEQEHRNRFVALGGEDLVRALGYLPTAGRRSPPGRDECVAALRYLEGVLPRESIRSSDWPETIARFAPASLGVDARCLVANSLAHSAHGAAKAQGLHVDAGFGRLETDAPWSLLLAIHPENCSAAFLRDVARAVVRSGAQKIFIVGELARPTGEPALSALRSRLENPFLKQGLAKSTSALRVTPFADLERATDRMLVVLAPLPEGAATSYPLEFLLRERSLHMDMLRESSRRSDAHLARYHLAADFVAPGMRVVDAACGLGYGSAILHDAAQNVIVVGWDISETAIQYARDVFGPPLPDLEFHPGDVAQLPGIEPATVDLVASFETLEHVEDLDGVLTAVHRVLRENGRFICSVPNRWVDESGRDPNPFHVHTFDLPRLLECCSRFFHIDGVWRQSAGGHAERFSPQRMMRLCKAWEQRADAEWWLLSGLKRESPAKQFADAAYRPLQLQSRSGAFDVDDVDRLAHGGIFGASTGGRRIAHVLRDFSSCVADWYCDNDSALHGKWLLGLEVIPPSSVPERLRDFVVIGSVHRDAIRTQLLALGVPEQRIITVDLDASKATLKAALRDALARMGHITTEPAP